MTQWKVKFEGALAPVIIRASSFREAVDQAKAISERILSIQYLSY
jgi:hypothetical protein